MPHPVGDRDEGLIVRRGADIAGECVRILTTPADELAREFEGKRYPTPGTVMPR